MQRLELLCLVLLAASGSVCAQPELFVQHASTSAGVWTLEAGGDRVLAAQPINQGAPLPGWKLAAVTDLNLDGNPDLVWTDDNGQVFAWYMIDKSGTVFGHAEPIGGPGQLAGWRVVGFADLNHDGHPDLLLEGTAPDTKPAARGIMVWYLTGGDGNQFLASATIGSFAGWTAAGVADFDQDGNADILWQNEATQQAAIWYLNPAGLVEKVGFVLRAPEAGFRIAGARDLDGDQRPDIVWLSGSGSSLVVWHMNGADFLRRAAVEVSGPGAARVVVPTDGSAGPRVTLDARTERWNGVNYSPRYHAYFRMLKDWNQYDPRLGKHVYEAADDDMDLLSRNGFNLLHLYLWDKQLLDDAVLDRWCPFDPDSGRRPAGCSPPYSEPAGFPNFPNSPTSTPEGASQFAALQDFVARAERHGLFVALHFASGTLIEQEGRLSQQAPPPGSAIPSCDDLTAGFSRWASQFITALTPVHRNVLLWGVAFAFGSDASDQTDLTGNPSLYNRCFGQIYQAVDTASRQSAPAGMQGMLGLIGVNPEFPFVAPAGASAARQFRRPQSGYSWDIATTQRAVKSMTDELTALYGRPRSPDVYMFSFYNANAADLAKSVDALIHSTDGDPSRVTVPADRIFPIEFAISSSGTHADSWGDNQTPTTTVDGQDTWLRNTLCAFRSLGIEKFAYWAMYDAVNLWVNAPWYNQGQQLAWNGYWGLAFEPPEAGFKPAWATLALFNRSPDALACRANPAPNITAWPLSDYVTIGQTPKIIWTATETTSLALDGQAQGGAWACDASDSFLGGRAFSTTLAGSCAFTFGAATNSPGDRVFTLSAHNGGQEQRIVLHVEVGLAPKILKAMGVEYSGGPVSVASGEIFYVSGKGLALTPINYLRWSRPGYPDVFMFHGDQPGHFFEQDALHVATTVDQRIARGLWTVSIYNGQSPVPAVIGPVNVY